MTKTELFEILDKNAGRTIDYILTMESLEHIVNLQTLYKEWRNKYIHSKGVVYADKLDLDKYCENVASRSTSGTTAVQIKKAILLKKSKMKIGCISSETKIEIHKLDNILSQALRYEFK